MTDVREARFNWSASSELPPGGMRLINDRRSGIVYIEIVVLHGDTPVSSVVPMQRTAFVAKLAEAGIIP